MNLKFSETGNAIVDYLTISDEAFLQIKELIKSRSEPCEGIRVSVRTRGCSGLSYTIEYALKEKNISKFDDVVTRDGISVFIDPKVSMFLIGSQMIYKTDELNSGFDFVNPNEKGRCGCGESFKA
ncbi:MAG: iron-sulfur cluster assembly accessory protein [Proteobacteria bacterium]|nr:iron-sulfur cluster assembly accessory protein [Pseudomonadota bacterium]